MKSDKTTSVPRILIYDNYDSFTYNLVHMVERILGRRVEVHRNDAIHLDEVESFDRIIISPGPGIPEEAGELLPLIRRYAPTKPMLGVCLGHQAIGQVFGGTLVNLDEVYHGIASEITVVDGLKPTKKGNDWYDGLGQTVIAGRYHSWVVDGKSFPKSLEATAIDSEGRVMALRHREYDVQGVQFHPESILTPQGERMLRNWLNIPEPAGNRNNV